MGRAIGSVLTVVGYAVGSYFGYPQLGAIVGSIVGGALTPTPEGPGPGDLTGPAIQLGTRVGRPYGQVRVFVSQINMPDEFRAIEHSSGGKGGPEGPSSYTYETDVLALVCDSTRVIAVTREWWNKKLIFTSLAASSSESRANSALTDYYASVTDYFGGPSQMPAPLYEDRVGAANALANRGMFTREYASVQCGTAKQLPMVEVEVITNGTAGDGDVFLLLNFENGNGTTFEDESSRGYTVTASNTEITEDAARFGFGGATNTAVINSASGFATAVSEDWTIDDDYTGEIRVAINGDPNATIRLVGIGTNDGVLAFTIYDNTSPDFKNIRLEVFDEFVDGDIATPPGPPDYPIALGSSLDITIDWHGASRTARAILGGTVILQHTYTGSAAPTQIGTAYSMSVASTGMSAGTWEADGARHTMRRRYAASAAMPDAAPTDDSLGIWTPLPETLDDVILSELGLHPEFDPADVDVTDVASVEVRGFLAVGDPASAVAELCDRLYVDIVPGNPIRFVRRGAASVATIAYADTGVGAGQPGARFSGLEQGGDDEISGVKAIGYPDINRDHNAGFQRADRLTTEGPDVQRITTRLVMTAEEAKGRAITATLMDRLNKQGAKFAISDKYAVAEPGDCFTVPDQDGNSYRLRIDRLRYSDGVKDCEWKLDDPSALIASGIADMSDEPGIEVAAAGVAEWQAMDLPQLRDADQGPGYYLASKTSDDSRAFAYESANDTTYTEVQQFGLDSVFGRVTALAGTLVAGNLFNEDATITVNVGDGTLASATRAALLSDRTINAFAITDAAGVCRVVGQFRDATPASAGVYDLSGILVDRWEDARYVGAVAVGDVFCRLGTTGGIARIARSPSQLGVAHYVKVVAERRVPASIAGVAFTAAGVSMLPLSPVGLHSERDAGSGDITITWLRRTRMETRFGGDLGDSCPLGEASEAYRVRLYSDATFTTLVRDLGTVTTASVTYTSAQRSADGHSLYSPIYPDVRMVSAAVGEGYALQVAA
jgi:hypothetical protein